MYITQHARERMEQRNFTENVLAATIDDFHRFGTWDYTGNRLTLDSSTDDFHDRLESLKALIINIRSILKRFRKDGCHNVSYEPLKEKYRILRRRHKSLEKLEHKGQVTLVIVDNRLVTIYKSKKRRKLKTGSCSDFAFSLKA